MNKPLIGAALGPFPGIALVSSRIRWAAPLGIAAGLLGGMFLTFLVAYMQYKYCFERMLLGRVR